MKEFTIGVIIGSTRSARICPMVTQYVVDTINSQQWQKSFTLSVVDLKVWNLPMFDEPKVPATIKQSEDYEHDISRKCSKEVSTYDAFIFIAPQYNWGYPSCLKNAIDYLFNEWTGKPAMIVTYGSHGGEKCYSQLKQVLEGLNMKVSDQGVLICYPTKKEILNGIPRDFHFDQLPGLDEIVKHAFSRLLSL